MILHPGIIALSAGSLLVSLMAVYAAAYGVTILKYWDLQCGSERQLRLERKTYLVSTAMTYVFAYQLGSLFLFIFTADKLSPLFVGAMCAAGTLNVNGCGYPALGLKVINFWLAGAWLLVNYTDNQAIDYPLIKRKYLFLLFLAPFAVAEMVLQWGYFFRLDAQVITSCCGSIFSAAGKGVGAAFTALPSIPMKVVFYLNLVLTGIAGLAFFRRGRPGVGYVFSVMSGITFLLSLAAVISVFSLYYYQLPTHHCPFCILQREYGYVGYPLYLCLLVGVVTGTAAGILIPARSIASLQEIWTSIQRRLTMTSLVSYFIFSLIATAPMIFSGFKLEGMR
jgi:hypothetical protein